MSVSDWYQPGKEVAQRRRIALLALLAMAREQTLSLAVSGGWTKQEDNPNADGNTQDPTL